MPAVDIQHFFLVGVSHKTAPVSVREKLSFSEERSLEIVHSLLEKGNLSEVVLLSTCNRTEFYAVSLCVEKAEKEIRDSFCLLSGFEKGTADSFLYSKKGREAVAHVFAVTSGLDSMVLGEPQIVGQMKEAYQQALQTRQTFRFFNKLFPQAFRVSKRVRSQTELSKRPVSVSFAAVTLAEKIFGDLDDKKAVVVGAGEMSELTARHLLEKKIGSLFVVNRTEEKAAELAGRLGCQSLSYSRFFGEIDSFDIILTSTSAEKPILLPEHFRSKPDKKKSPVFIIDIAVPRNVDPLVNEIDTIYLYDIDHLQGVVEENRKFREQESLQGFEIIAEEVSFFEQLFSEATLGQTIQQFSAKLHNIREKEMKMFFSRFPDLDEEQKQAFDLCTRLLVNKILHEPIIHIKKHETPSFKYSDMIKKLFQLDEDP